jgi:hypothetical protein
MIGYDCVVSLMNISDIFTTELFTSEVLKIMGVGKGKTPKTL